MAAAGTDVTSSPQNAQPDDLLFGYLRRDLTPLVEDLTVQEALDFVRQQGLGERIVYFYVVDASGRLVGVIPTRRLLTAGGGTAISALMVRGVVTLPTDATIRDASAAFVKHKLLALPVVDDGGHLHGVADVGLFAGDISDVTARQNAQDIFQMIGLHLSRTVTPWAGFRDRFPWLLSNIAGGLIAAVIAAAYESLLTEIIVLALFMPVVLALGESISMQSVTLTLQSFRHATIDWKLLRRGLWLEVRTAALLGLASGVVIGAVAFAWKGNPVVGGALVLTLTLAMTLAAVFGVAFPTALRAMSRDPGIAAGPIVLAITDFATLLVYFNVGTVLLR
jgi:magnesium transporter